MEATSDSRYDPNFDLTFAPGLLLDVAQERSLERLMEKTVRAAIARPAIARVEIWLIEAGDLCSRCPQRPECPDQSRCLHLIAGGINPLKGLATPNHSFSIRMIEFPSAWGSSERSGPPAGNSSWGFGQSAWRILPAGLVEAGTDP